RDGLRHERRRLGKQVVAGSCEGRRPPSARRRWHSVVMIVGTHAIIYAEDAETARAFFRDVLGLPNVDAHGGWLIFKLPPAELGIHPAGTPGDPTSGAPSGHHE